MTVWYNIFKAMFKFLHSFVMYCDASLKRKTMEEIVKQVTEVDAAGAIKNTVYWDVKPCSLVDVYRCLRRNMLQPSPRYRSILFLEYGDIRFLRSSANIYQTTRRRNSQTERERERERGERKVFINADLTTSEEQTLPTTPLLRVSRWKTKWRIFVSDNWRVTQVFDDTGLTTQK
jgi:hypothetical protein